MQRDSLKTRILDHAELRLLEQGYRGMRVDELAHDVGISKRTLYEQFRTKEDMAREALLRLLDGVHHRVDEAVASDADEADKLRTIVVLMTERFVNARPAFYRDLETTPVLTELILGSRRRTDAAIEAVITAGIDHARFRQDLDARLARSVLLAAVDEMVRPEVLLADRLDLAQAVSRIVDLLLRGMAAGPAPMQRDVEL